MSTPTSRFSSAPLLLAAAAPVAFGAFGVFVALGRAPARDWFWPPPDTNVVEAAALGDAARVRTLAATGASLVDPARIRPGLLDDDHPEEMSALEAAVRRRRDALVQTIVELGARPSADDARRLTCLARGEDDAGTAAVLARAFAIPADACGDQTAQGQPSSANE
jgi:hypothetical protein